MMNIMILDRTDLKAELILKPIDEVATFDFDISELGINKSNKFHLILFKCSLEKKIKVLKNRYGEAGIYPANSLLNIISQGE